METVPKVPPEPPLMLDVVAVARLLKCSKRHVWRMCAAGEFPLPVTVGKRLKRWPRSVVVAWTESQPAGARL